MIKLNNKNITYVALADSNNSLKAPKEIWYADSSNSVKLVYRRKDALIEGVDYEKYHWLVGDGHSYINTLKLIKSDSEVRSIIIPTSDDFTRWKYIYANDPSDIASTFMCVLLKNNSTLHFRHKRGNITFAINTEYECVHSIDSVKVNNEVLTPVSESEFQESDAPLYLFSAPTISSTSDLLFDGYIRHLILSDELNLIPCKLLKPVPKWLDANGIRRQIGECGMIDLVSGKFYGNVNNVGTFTVENYYERKEWLKVQTTTQTGTYLTLSLGTSMNFNFKRVWLSDFLNTWYFSTPGYVYYTDNHRLIAIWDSANAVSVNSGDTSTINVGDTITIDSTPDLLLINGKTINRYNYTSGIVHWCNAVAKEITSLTSSIIVDEAERYIPCTLTMDLPASMDANNIARTKGTSGMWDLVSDKFYGNVANSGTFKAVNLAEGVDYEVHQWLKGDGNAYINTLITSYSGIIKVAFKSGASTNCAIFGREATKSDFTDRIVLLRYPYAGVSLSALYGTSTTRHYDLATDLNDEEITIDLDNQIMTNKSGNSIQINIGVNVTGSSVILFGKGYGESVVNGIAPSDVAIKKFSVSNQINLIPVKLLKSIPSKYDANGIARQAGECGMYDTVNDVFYGNVASSGSFTVSDDE